MAGLMASLTTRSPVSRTECVVRCPSSSSQSLLRRGGGRQQQSPVKKPVTVVGGRRCSKAGGRDSSLGQRHLVAVGSIKGNFPWESDERGFGRRCRTRSTMNSLAAETSSSSPDEIPSASTDSEEGAPMRKSSFVARIQRILRLIVGFLKRFSPGVLLKRLASLLRKRGTRQILMWTIAATGVGLYFCSTLTGSASPQVVPYSELVDHLKSRTVTSALFEEGSSHIYFNLRRSKESNPVIVVHGDAEKAPEGGDAKELMAGVAVSDGGSIDQGSVADESELLSSPGATTTNEVSSIRTEITSARKGLKSISSKWQYTTRRVKNDEAFLLPMMRDAGVRYSSAPQSVSAAFKTVLITIITLWIPLSPLLWLLHRQMTQNSGNGKKKRSVKRLVKFEDVAGVDLAKAELMEIVDCMRGATKFTSLGAKLPKGVLLVGPPGTGKTLLARAVAGEAGVPFFAASASEFVEMFVGRGAARIRELFSEARKNIPSIVFIDELDAVGGRRGRSFNDERDQTLNQLLTEMDGFESDTGVLVLAATNRPEALDPALCRPGRLSRRIHVTEPDLQGRQQVLAVHMREVPVEGDPLMLQRMVASMTPGFVGADLANLVNEAALLAARKGRSAVINEDFKEAVDRVKYGVGDRPRNVFTEVEQKFGAWFSSLSPETAYPILPSSG